MVWKKKSEGHWLLYIDGKLRGDVVLVKYKNGKTEYQGQAMNRETRQISKVVHGSTATPVKAAVEKMAKAQSAKTKC